MRETLAALCGSFIENRDAIRSEFGWESAYFYPICAAVFTDRRQRADVARMRDCRAMLKEQTGLFSQFRGLARLPLTALLAADSDPEGMLRRALQIHDALREHFFSSPYLPVSAFVLAGQAPAQYGGLAARTRRIYNLMKADHPFLTSSEDSVFAALLALSPLSDEEIAAEAEACYDALRPAFFPGNAVQSLSHVLALGAGEPADKSARALALYDRLRDAGYKYGTGYELATLGVPALLDADLDAVAADIMAADDFLAGQKGYGLFGLGRRQRLMHAGMLVASDYLGPSGGPALSTAAIGGTISLIAAQQASMCAAIAASTAAAASASSSSN